VVRQGGYRVPGYPPNCSGLPLLAVGQFPAETKEDVLVTTVNTPLPLLLLHPARFTIASHNIFLRTLIRGCHGPPMMPGAVQTCGIASSRRDLSNHPIYNAPAFILFPKVGLERSAGFSWINLSRSPGINMNGADKIKPSSSAGINMNGADKIKPSI
jgi:hypothetical protein